MEENKFINPFNLSDMENSMKEYNECGYQVRQILNSFDFEGDAYKECDRLLNELEPYGYTFDYGLDGEPYNLKKIPMQVFAIIGFADKLVSLEDARDNSLTLTQDESYLVGYEDAEGNECNEDGTYL
tara:strand:+ start:3182 stop:3562 length:381 start_codon:yes stop_codon:yes gene_type:complete